MVRDAQPLVVRIQARHAGTADPLGSVGVVAYLKDEPDGSVLARALTGHDGFAELGIDADQWRNTSAYESSTERRLVCRSAMRRSTAT